MPLMSLFLGAKRRSAVSVSRSETRKAMILTLLAVESACTKPSSVPSLEAGSNQAVILALSTETDWPLVRIETVVGVVGADHMPSNVLRYSAASAGERASRQLLSCSGSHPMVELAEPVPTEA